MDSDLHMAGQPEALQPVFQGELRGFVVAHGGHLAPQLRDRFHRPRGDEAVDAVDRAGGDAADRVAFEPGGKQEPQMFADQLEIAPEKAAAIVAAARHMEDLKIEILVARRLVLDEVEQGRAVVIAIGQAERLRHRRLSLAPVAPAKPARSK
jgi:hypothetical protein